ncbi:MAG: extracellular solute-binding protein [Phycisphaerales bacterium]|jgi:iron(III) transport system substrate-binding protein|nr:extracellular solute-binding protein [Phycisphaerales bacterium]
MKVLKNSILVAVLFVCSCSSDEPNTLVVYASADEKIAREVFDAFTEESGIAVAWVGDSESSKNTGLVTRLRREKSNPIADVFWSSENIGTIQLAQEDVFASLHSPLVDRWPEEHRDAENLWFAFSPRVRVIAYDPAVVKKEELPVYWWEYTDAVFADPRFGTTGTHFAVMAGFSDKYNQFLRSLHREPLFGGNAATVQAVIDGTATFAMTDSDDVHAAIARGASIESFAPRHRAGVGGGTLLIPNTVAVVKGSKHPAQARSFVEFMLSDTVATILASSNSKNIPLQQTVASKFPDLQVDDPLIVDFVAAANRRDLVIRDSVQQLKDNRARN